MARQYDNSFKLVADDLRSNGYTYLIISIF